MPLVWEDLTMNWEDWDSNWEDPIIKYTSTRDIQKPVDYALAGRQERPRSINEARVPTFRE